jgi:hypothetical protein
LPGEVSAETSSETLKLKLAWRRFIKSSQINFNFKLDNLRSFPKNLLAYTPTSNPQNPIISVKLIIKGLIASIYDEKNDKIGDTRIFASKNT